MADSVIVRGVRGPSTATDNAIARFDGTTGKLVQNSGAIVDDTGNVLNPGYLRVGSTSAPSNTTAGDLTAVRLSLGNSAAFGTSAGRIVSITGTMTDTASGASIFMNVNPTLSPTANSSTEFRALTFSNLINADAGVTVGTIVGGNFENRIGGNQTGNISAAYALSLNGLTITSASANTTADTVSAIKVTPYSKTSGSATLTVTDMNGIEFGNPGNGNITGVTNFTYIKIPNTSISPTTNQIGIDIAALTRGGTSDIGIRIAKADTYSLQLSDTGGSAAGGITFGTDTNLYRSAANTLKTDDSLTVAINLTVTGTSALNDNITVADAKNIILNTTTGTKIGTATSQKLGFFNATPVIQPTAATDIRTLLSNLGLSAGNTNPLAPRIATVASSGTPTINTDTTDQFNITALAANITSMTTNLSGTPTDGQKLMIRFKDDGTPRTITWGASFASRGSTLLATTTAGKVSYVGLIWNGVALVWDCVATVTEA